MTDLEFRKLMKDNFTRDQIIWFASNGSYNPDDTEGEIKADVARQLFDAKMDKTPDQTDKLLKFINGPKQTYDLQSFAQAAGFKDLTIGNKKLTAADQFYASYPKASRADRELWNAGITGAFGDDGLDKLNRVMASEGRNREYAAQRKYDERSTVNKIIDAVISPRQAEARAEGRVPSDTDELLDRTENVLMALPLTTGAKVIGRMARVPRIASKILNGGGAYAAATVGVPHAMEALDAAFYDPEENLDRSTYRESDAVLGSLTNVVAPKALSLKTSKIGRYLPWNKGKPGMSEVGKAQIDQAIADGLWTKPDKETVKAVKQYNSLQTHGGEVDKVMPEFHENLISEMETGVPTNSLLDKSRASGIIKYADKNASNNAQDYIEAGFVQKAADDMDYKGTKQILDGMAETENFDDIIRLSDQVLKDANPMDLLRYRNPKMATAVDAALEAGKNWGVNKYGSKRDADIILSGVSRMLGSIDPSLNLSKMLEDSRKKDIENQRNEVKKSQAKQILDTQKLEAEDREWLNKLIKNPKMMEGYGEGSSSKFKNWLLLRGQDILRGTELFRPTYEVE